MSTTRQTYTGSSVIGIFGDSISTSIGGGAVAWWTSFQQTLGILFGGFNPPALGAINLQRNFHVPRLRFDANTGGTSGRSFASSAGTIATVIKNFPPLTHLIWQLSINDCVSLNAGNLATFLANVQTCINAGQTICPGSNTTIIGPWAHAAGDLVTAIALCDANLPGAINAVGGNYVKWSNVPNTGGRSIADGTHPTAAGSVDLTTEFMKSVSIAI